MWIRLALLSLAVSFDLLKGYRQVPLTPRPREIAAFITPSGLYSYTVMPFGLRNAPATFQHLMNKVVFNLEECEFVQATVTYLGKVVGQGQVRPVRAKVLAVSCSDYQERALLFLGYGGVLP